MPLGQRHQYFYDFGTEVAKLDGTQAGVEVIKTLEIAMAQRYKNILDRCQNTGMISPCPHCLIGSRTVPTMALPNHQSVTPPEWPALCLREIDALDLPHLGCQCASSPTSSFAWLIVASCNTNFE